MPQVNNFTRFLFGAVMGFIISFFLTRHLLYTGKPVISTPDKTVVVRLVSKVDTMWVKQIKHDTIHIASPTIVKTDTVYKPGTKELAFIPNIRRTYSDTTKMSLDSIRVNYSASVNGTLNNIKLGYTDYKAVKTILRRDSVFTTTTISKNVGGLFIGLDAGYNTVTPKLEYIKNNNSFSAGYNIITKSPQIGYSRKLF